MQQRFDSLPALLNHGFDSIIDVRSPAEFAIDHIPGALNMPVLDDDQRAKVGTIYVQQSAFLARKIGGAMVYRNAAAHIETHLMDKPGGWRPLVYCWRGGQRSGSFAHLMQQIGWRAEQLEGGYQSYRRLVNAALYDHPLPMPLIALDGFTGTAKTELLPRLAARGVQVLDLEGAARHRGSLLGEMPGGQPSQKAFESTLACALAQMDPTRVLVVEAESNKIGARIIPPALWTALKTAPRYEITAPVEARVRYLQRAYDDILSDSVRLKDRLSPLRQHRGQAVVQNWFNHIHAGDRAALVRSLIADHYDPAYLKSRNAHGHSPARVFHSDGLDPDDLSRVADRIAAEIKAQIAAR